MLVRWSGSSMLIWIAGSWWWNNKIGHWKEGMETWASHTCLNFCGRHPSPPISKAFMGSLKPILSFHKPTLNIAVKGQFFPSCNCSLCQFETTYQFGLFFPVSTFKQTCEFFKYFLLLLHNVELLVGSQWWVAWGIYSSCGINPTGLQIPLLANLKCISLFTCSSIYSLCYKTSLIF